MWPGETELFSLYEDELGGTRPDRLAGVGPQERVQCHSAKQIIVPSVDVPVLHMVEQLGLAAWELIPASQMVEQGESVEREGTGRRQAAHVQENR